MITTPVTIYVVHHPDCKAAEALAKKLFDWFRLGYLTGDSSAAGLPLHFRRTISKDVLPVIAPSIPFERAEVNVVILLVDHKLVEDPRWRHAAVKLAEDISKRRKNQVPAAPQVMLLPAAMHESFYRLGPLYEDFNPIRLLGLTEVRMEAALRRSATEAIARLVRARETPNLNSRRPASTRSTGRVAVSDQPPPLEVFLSHAKADGTEIAEYLRDGVRKFSQLLAWYDANDLPYGAEWKSPMVAAVEKDTAAMIATVTDAYPTRPWCRTEAKLARTPARAKESAASQVWKVQPVVAVHQPRGQWVRGVPMLDGVPRIGWDPERKDEDTARVIDRLVLEVLLATVHRRLAVALEERLQARSKKAGREYCFITWVPDTWTLVSLRKQLGRRALSVRRIVYPGYGLSDGEIEDLQVAVAVFPRGTKLISYDDQEVWS
jgi:hypothetical protein